MPRNDQLPGGRGRIQPHRNGKGAGRGCSRPLSKLPAPMHRPSVKKTSLPGREGAENSYEVACQEHSKICRDKWEASWC